MIGGVYEVIQNGQIAAVALAPMTEIQVFDTKTNQWDIKQATVGTSTVLPSTRTNHNAVVSK